MEFFKSRSVVQKISVNTIEEDMRKTEGKIDEILSKTEKKLSQLRERKEIEEIKSSIKQREKYMSDDDDLV